MKGIGTQIHYYIARCWLLGLISIQAHNTFISFYLCSRKVKQCSSKSTIYLMQVINRINFSFHKINTQTIHRSFSLPLIWTSKLIVEWFVNNGHTCFCSCYYTWDIILCSPLHNDKSWGTFFPPKPLTMRKLVVSKFH